MTNRFKNKMDIAVIGISGKYPEANTMDEYWELLSKGKNAVKEIPKERWNHSEYFFHEKQTIGKTYTKWGGFIDNVDEFDARLFGISPHQAPIMDPQERLFLMSTYETFEDAGFYPGLDNKNEKGESIGVFAATMWSDYPLFAAEERLKGRPMVLSSNIASIANRISYFFNLTGPSIAIDSMCSSSLNAIHLACSSIKNGECKMAIAGGVNVALHPSRFFNDGALQNGFKQRAV